MISEEIIEELFVRFFTDVTLYCTDMRRCFWQLEKMYWYYLGLTKSSQKPSKIGMKKFLEEIKSYLCEILPDEINVDKEFENWMLSRKTIPRVKVILLDRTCKNVVLTKGVYNNYLIFPGGKVEETDISLAEAAIRETYEEIGVDITNYIDESLYFDMTQWGVKNRYFVIPNFDMNIYMQPNVVNEVEYIKWFPLLDIPINPEKHNLTKAQMKLIIESVSNLKEFIGERKIFSKPY